MSDIKEIYKRFQKEVMTEYNTEREALFFAKSFINEYQSTLEEMHKQIEQLKKDNDLLQETIKHQHNEIVTAERKVEQLKKENEELKYSVTYESEHKQVYFDKIQDLKCCANCINISICLHKKKRKEKFNNVCKNWIFDRLTQKEREV